MRFPLSEGRPSTSSLWLLPLLLPLGVLLAACGGGASSGSPATPAAPANTASGTVQAQTAPALPVTPQPSYAASGVGSYADTLDRYNQVGEALHGQ